MGIADEVLGNDNAANHQSYHERADGQPELEPELPPRRTPRGVHGTKGNKFYLLTCQNL